jgi:uncharacterized damage-inducible protein DinB
MQDLDPRIRAALISVDPTTKNPAWHGVPTAIGVLRGVTPAMAVWRPYPGANNIREIALHIAFWENSAANRLSGKTVRVSFEQRKTGWAIRGDSLDATQWKSEIAFIKATHQRLTDAVTGFDPGMLDQPLGKQTTRNAIEFIHGVAEHRLYHTAQMEMTKTLAKHKGIG